MQPSEDRLLSPNFFADAIDHHPRIVAPALVLADVVKLMTQGRRQTDRLIGKRLATQSSCVLVIEQGKLLGIFTERDVVKLTVQGIDFAVTTVGEVMTSPVITIDEQAFQDDICAALFLFRRYQIRHLVAIDKFDRLIGVISQDSIHQVLHPTNLLKLRRVSEVMISDVIHAPMDVSVMSLAQLMAEHLVSCIVITKIAYRDDGMPVKEPVGIVTERDLVKMRSQGLNFIETFAGEVMSSPLFLLHPEDSLWTAQEEMHRRRVQRLVVSWDAGTKLGILTQTNLLRIFDSIEHHAVMEVVQQVVTELICVPTINSSENVETNLKTLMAEIQVHLQHLVDLPDLSRERQQLYLQLAIADLQKIGNLFDISV